MKTVANKALILKHKHPGDSKLQDSHRKILKEFKNICRTKKNQFWKKEIENLNNIKKDDNFWEKWKKIGENLTIGNQFADNIDGQKWENHFKNLFTKENGDIDKIMEKIVTPNNSELNSKFKMEELKNTINALKNKKAVGPDNIANEFLKLAPENLLIVILDYMNLNLEKGITCSKWCFDTISLIHKDGPKDDPNNYRGICIMNTLLKILCTLLNNRLIKHCSSHKLINKEQIGFQQNNRTSDHILTLKSIVNKYVTDQQGKKLYTCFVDFQKAFDSIWHDGLFRKLENKKINGNFLNLIKNIYSQTQCAVKMNNKTTAYFKYQKGVQQGNPLSPLLFNLFINDIFDILKNDSSLITLDNQYDFNALMYADDLIMMSPTQEGLQKSIDNLSNYCKKWKLSINTKKTKCMIFSKGTNIKKTNFILNGRNITTTKEYKYLGITINSRNCTFTPTLNDLSCKANKAIYGLLSMLPIKMVPIKTMLKIFDTCITPILLYGSEVWGPFMNHDWKAWDTTQTERVHTQFLKRILGINRSTTNALARGEVGRHSLQEYITTRNINYIKYIEAKNTESLAKQAANYEILHRNERNSLYSIIAKHEQNITNHNIHLISKSKLSKLIREEFNILWQAQIASFPKADTFKQFKGNVKFENYLTDIKNRKHRVSYTKYRLSDHCLKIEKGRHQRPIIPREQRFCPFCPTIVESEIHFLTQCNAYTSRNEFYSKIEKETPNFTHLNDQEKFIFLMTQENKLINQEIISIIHKWLDQRLQYETQQ